MHIITTLRFKWVSAGIVLVAAVESILVLLLVNALSDAMHLKQWSAHVNLFSQENPIVIGGFSLVIIAVLRITLSRVIQIEAGRIRRKIEALNMHSVLTMPLYHIEHRTKAEAETIMADIKCLSELVADLRVFIPSAVSAIVLIVALVWLSLWLSLALGIVIIGFSLTMRWRFNLVGARDIRLSSHKYA